MKITMDELIDAGFERYANWWIKGNVSVNLASNTILHGHTPGFSIGFDELPANPGVTLQDVQDFSRIMAKLTGY